MANQAIVVFFKQQRSGFYLIDQTQLQSIKDVHCSVVNKQSGENRVQLSRTDSIRPQT